MAWQTVCPLLGGRIWDSRWDSVRITSSVLWSLLYCNGKLIKPVPNLWNSKRYECGYWQQPSRVSTSQASETTNIISSCPKNNCLCVSLLYVSRLQYLHVVQDNQPITTAPIKLQPLYGKQNPGKENLAVCRSPFGRRRAIKGLLASHTEAHDASF